ncbi:MAG: hypothetical protein J6D47_13290 [Peptostreptococcaceae bacterium]|nr:hypothetical protein [Peptostreptococcaceae bacterium]
MAKLDKQGLNTFIRELDKHINTKINKIGASSPTSIIAENVILADGTTVEFTVTKNKNNISNLQSNVNALQSELGTNKSTLQNNINVIREVL